MFDGLTTSGDDPTARLEQLKALATQQYSLKNYEAAAEHYSEAAEAQDLINGEMSPESADLLYQYGRCLYHVAVANSDVLGGKVASTDEPKRKKRKVAKAETSDSAPGGSGLIGDAIQLGEQMAGDGDAEAIPTGENGNESKSANPQSNSNPYFQITGDENWTDSEDEGEEDEDGEGDPEEVEDDFATAYEILDMARVLLARKLEGLEGDSSEAGDAKNKGKQLGERPEVRQVKERLADTHDLQAEISLENERFPDAVHDMREALVLKKHLYPQESSLLAEAHFKLSLALEFASVTQTTAGEGDNSAPQAAQVDEVMRAEAATQLEAAIASCKLRIAKEEAAAAAPTDDPTKTSSLHRSIADVKDMVADMQQRLVDLRAPTMSLSGLQGLGSTSQDPADDPLRGVLGAILGGSSKAEQQKRLAEATEQANDLSGLVKHRKKPKTEASAQGAETSGSEGKGKRKAEDRLSSSSSLTAAEKKVKFQD